MIWRKQKLNAQVLKCVAGAHVHGEQHIFKPADLIFMKRAQTPFPNQRCQTGNGVLLILAFG